MSRTCREAVNWYEKAAYEGSKVAQKALAKLYFDGGRNLKRSYYTSYVWCCVSEMVEEFSRSANIGGSITGVILLAGGAGLYGLIFDGASIALAGAAVSVAVPLAGNIFLLTEIFADRSIKEEIEGVGLFNLAKLSDTEMASAQHEA